MRKFFRKLFLYFLNGIVVILPFAVTIGLLLYPMNWLSSKIGSFANTVFSWVLTDGELDDCSRMNAFLIFLKRFLPSQAFSYLKQITGLPYINLLFAGLLFTIFGAIASNVLIQSGLKWIEQLILKVPLLNLLYSYVKESTAAFVGKFNKPVLVTINKELSIQKIGFITQENLHNLNVKTQQIAVYLPHSYALSGELSFFHKEDVQRLQISTVQAWKLILSGGLAEVKQ